MLNDGNQLHNFISSSCSGTVIYYGSGSDLLKLRSSPPLWKRCTALAKGMVFCTFHSVLKKEILFRLTREKTKFMTLFECGVRSLVCYSIWVWAEGSYVLLYLSVGWGIVCVTVSFLSVEWEFLCVTLYEREVRDLVYYSIWVWAKVMNYSIWVWAKGSYVLLYLSVGWGIVCVTVSFLSAEWEFLCVTLYECVIRDLVCYSICGVRDLTCYSIWMWAEGSYELLHFSVGWGILRVTLFECGVRDLVCFSIWVWSEGCYVLLYLSVGRRI